MTRSSDQSRLRFLLETVRREGVHLLSTTERLFQHELDAHWVMLLDQNPELSERVDAFVARFGRMQDTLGDKLIPTLRRCLLETPGAALENLNRMEKLGLLSSVLRWTKARNLRNRLVNEYQRDADEFAGALNRARELVPLFVETYNRINRYARAELPAPLAGWPNGL